MMHEAWERKVTFRQCLGHQTPFPAVEPIYTYGRDPELLRAFILQREWRARDPVYSDINFILLGFALERLSGETIRDMDPGPALPGPPSRIRPPRPRTAPGAIACCPAKCMTTIARRCKAPVMPGLFGTAASVLDFAQGLLDGTGAPNARSR